MKILEQQRYATASRYGQFGVPKTTVSTRVLTGLRTEIKVLEERVGELTLVIALLLLERDGDRERATDLDKAVANVVKNAL